MLTTRLGTAELAGLWPLFGLLIETPRLQLRLPREDELPAGRAVSSEKRGGRRPRLPVAVPGELDQQHPAVRHH